MRERGIEREGEWGCERERKREAGERDCSRMREGRGQRDRERGREGWVEEGRKGGGGRWPVRTG